MVGGLQGTKTRFMRGLSVEGAIRFSKFSSDLFKGLAGRCSVSASDNHATWRGIGKYDHERMCPLMRSVSCFGNYCALL